MKTSHFSQLFAVLALMVLGSCQNPASPAPPSAAEGPSGQLVIHLPPVATAIAAQVDGSRGLARVFAYASSYKVTVSTSTGSQNSTYKGSTSNAAAPVVLAVPVGSNLTVSIEIYNASVSTSTPTVVGKATGVVITNGGTTSLNLTCVPYSPPGLGTENPVAPTLGPNGEVYYSVAVTSGSRYTFTQTTNGMLMGLFDSTGAAVVNWTVTNGPMAYTATANTTLYVGLAATSTAFGSLTLTATVASSQGTTSSPVALPVETSFTFRMGGFSGLNNTSYYTLAPNRTGKHLLDLGPSASYRASLSTQSIGGTTVLAETTSQSGIVDLGTLSASTTYYLTVQNLRAGALVSSHGSVSLPKPLAVTETYTPDSVAFPYQSVWYEVPVTGGSSYNVNWDSGIDGTGSYNLWSSVDAYTADFSAYFTNATYGYRPSYPHTVTVPPGQSSLFLKVGDYYDGEGLGTYAIRVIPTPPPVASVTCATPVKAGNSLLLDGSASMGAVSYAWSILAKPAGSSATISSYGSSYNYAYFIPDAVGDYRFQLTVTNVVGTSTATLDVSAVAPPPPVVSASCTAMTGGSPLTLSALGTTGAVSYAWTITAKPTGSVASITSANSSYATFSPDVAGTYTFQLAATNLGGTSTAAVSATVTGGSP